MKQFVNPSGVAYSLHDDRAAFLLAQGVLTQADPDPVPTDDEGVPIPGMSSPVPPYTLNEASPHFDIAKALIDLDGIYP